MAGRFLGCILLWLTLQASRGGGGPVHYAAAYLKIGTIMDKAISQIVVQEDAQPTLGRIRVISLELGNET